MKKPRKTVARAAFASLACLTLLCIAFTATAQVSPPPDLDPGETEEVSWPYLFPLLGKKVLEKGYSLPLPWGLNFNYFYTEQDIVISDLQVGFNDGPLLPMDFIEFEKTTSTAQSGNLRVDLWLLPFLNVYGIVAGASTATNVDISWPIQISTEANFSGTGVGGGLTGAYGYEGYWVSLDTNWVSMNLDKLDDNVVTHVLSVRAGKGFTFKNGMQLAVWGGAMRVDISSETMGQLSLSELFPGMDPGQTIDDIVVSGRLDPVQQEILEELKNQAGGSLPDEVVVKYSLNKSIADPWNMLLGAQLGLSKHWYLRTEIGLIGRFSVLASVQYRFGLPFFKL